MELIVFDLDGTLLNRQGAMSEYTQRTLAELSRRGIAYTVATGRTLHAARHLLEGRGFVLPQIFKNGVMIWNPGRDEYTHQNFLSLDEIQHVIHATLARQVTPFVFTLEPGGRHGIYHPPTHNEVEARLAAEFSHREGVAVLPLSRLPAGAEITNISALGKPADINGIDAMIRSDPGLVAYSGAAWDGDDWRWIDIHHCDASKGGAIDLLRQWLDISRVVCFGDNDNDLSMFARADESYAPANATAAVRQAATAVIGDHDEDGIAHFLRNRFGLGP